MTNRLHLPFSLICLGAWFAGNAQGQNAKNEVTEIAAEKLFYEFVTNPVKGNLKFEGKVLKITGCKITAAIQERSLTVTYNVPDKPWGLNCVCNYDQATRKTVATLNFDQQVTIIGRLREESGSTNRYYATIVLDRCEFEAVAEEKKEKEEKK